MLRIFAPACGLALALATVPAGAAITLEFDYTYDTGAGLGRGPFFKAGTNARATLEAAGAFLEGILQDDFDAIVPSGSDTWSGMFINPETGTMETIHDLIVPADTVRIFVGARNLAGAMLGMGGPAGHGASGTASWTQTVAQRGEPAGEFAPWGGALSVDDSAIWNTDHDSQPGNNENDLYSVLLHELGHVLGLGLSDSWHAHVDALDNTFTGTHSRARHGGPVSLEADLSGNHWAEGTSSSIYLTNASQEALMAPSLSPETRKVFTVLDVAALADVGWSVPEPNVLTGWICGLLILCGRRRAHAAR